MAEYASKRPGISSVEVNFGNIPLEMQERRQWVVWARVERNGKVTKPPLRPSDPARQASVSDPSTWATFEEAVACYEANSWLGGVGYVFVEDDPFFGIDIDAERKVQAEHLERRQQQVRSLLTLETYTEISPSGEGYHIIGRGRTPVAGTQLNDVGIEVYGWNRFFTMTGHLYRDRREITDQQPLLDSIPCGRHPPAVDDEMLGDRPQYRRMDLDDNEVVRLAFEGHPDVLARYEGRADCEPGKWAKTAFFSVVARLDLVSGSVEQLRRIVMASPLVQQSQRSASGETRPRKAERIFLSALHRARVGEISCYPLKMGNEATVHGRWIALKWDGHKREREAETLRQAVSLARESTGSLSRGATDLLRKFAHIEEGYFAPQPPPGVVGDFVGATLRACPNPFLKYAIPATLATLSGIVGRGYKLPPDGEGLNQNYLLVAPSAAGKTQTMKVWKHFIEQANALIPATPAGPPRSRIINNSTASIQGMMSDFAAKPSCAWFVEECASQLQAMSGTGRSTQLGLSLRDKFNELYDASSHVSDFQPPASVEGRKSWRPIRNLNVSTFWTTVPEKFELVGNDAADGFLSRVVLVHHNRKSGSINESRDVQLPLHLLKCLRDALIRASWLDDAYLSGNDPEGKLVHVAVPQEVQDLFSTTLAITERVKDDAHDHKIPSYYVAVSRLLPIARRVAATLAVIENPNCPTITEHQLNGPSVT